MTAADLYLRPFASTAKLKVLRSVFYAGRPLSVREIVYRSGAGTRSVQLACVELSQLGIMRIISSLRGKRYVLAKSAWHESLTSFFSYEQKMLAIFSAKDLSKHAKRFMAFNTEANRMLTTARKNLRNNT